MKIFFKKLLFFLLLMAGIQMFLGALLVTGTVPKNIRKLDAYLKNRADIIYFGDSTVRSHNRLDKDRRSMSEMLQEMLPSHTIGPVDHKAYNMDIYLAFCEYITRERDRPKIIIIPINMRSFSPEWDLRPEYQFEKEKIFLKYNNFLFRAFYRPLAIFKAFNLATVSREQYENTPIYNGKTVVGKMKEFDNDSYLKFSEKNRKNTVLLYYYLYSYMYPLTKDHRKVKSMMHIARMLQSANIGVIFYITPLDYERGEKNTGVLFRRRARENVYLLHSVLEEEGVELLDLAFTLKTDLFDRESLKYITEHLKTRGRKFVAKKLYERINRIMR